MDFLVPSNRPLVPRIAGSFLERFSNQVRMADIPYTCRESNKNLIPLTLNYYNSKRLGRD